MELEELKIYLKLDDNEEDDFVQTLQMAAEEYFTNAGIRKDGTK